MNRKLPILLAVVVLIGASLACAAGSPSLSGSRSARDQDGKDATSVFQSSETIYVVSDLSNGVKGNVVGSKWFAVSVPGYDANTLLDSKDIPITDDSFSGTVYFYFPAPDGGWPAGSYKTEIYFNGALSNTVEFSVQ